MVRPDPTGPVARYFYDCEFIEDGRTIELVSIGVIAQDGREFYAVSTEFDPARANPWVRRHVLDKLPSPADPAWRSRAAIRDELYAFLTAPGLPIELWAWFAAYDHVVLAQLWGAMPDAAAGRAPVDPGDPAALGGGRLPADPRARAPTGTTRWPTPGWPTPGGRSRTSCSAAGEIHTSRHRPLLV